MMRSIAIILILLTSIEAFSQKLAEGKYWVQLRDKKYNEYSQNDPSAFLSQRSIERRLKQNIEITEEDLPVSAVYVDSLKNAGFSILGSSKWFNSVIVESYDSVLVSQLGKYSFVTGFSPVSWNFASGRLHHLQNGSVRDLEIIERLEYGEADKQINILGGNYLHSLGYTGKNKLIAVLDAGFYGVDKLDAFERIRSSGRLVMYRDFVDPESDFFTQSTHGLGVLSTIAGWIPGEFIGTAPDASFAIIRTEEASAENKIEEANWIMGAELADSLGADIITSSLGYSIFQDSLMNYSLQDIDGQSALVTRAAEKAFERGMIVVASAGNEGNDPWQKITPPADGPNVLSVGSIDTALDISSYSSLGPTRDGRIKPDVMAVGYRTRIINRSGEISFGYGTSFAAPQIAGMVACLWQVLPGKTNHEILESVRSSAHLYSSPDTLYGYGIPNFMLALWELDSDRASDLDDRINIYPNPFQAQFEIYNPENGEGIESVKIFRPEGTLVFSAGFDNVSGAIRISELASMPPGIYLIQTKTSSREFVSKLIKQ